MSHSSNNKKLQRWTTLVLIIISLLFFTADTARAKLQQSDKTQSIIHRHGSLHSKRTTFHYSGSAACLANCGYHRVRQKSPSLSAAFATNYYSNKHFLTTLQLKFKTFEEMIIHHHDTPLLIDFYAPWCGPCKLMKGEISSIRHQLDLLGPNNKLVGNKEGTSSSSEEEDCVVEDVIALSSVCLEDGYIEEQQQQQQQVVVHDVGEEESPLSITKEGTQQIVLKDILPSSTSTTEEEEQDTPSSTKQPPQTTTTTTTTIPSGIPVYHVNTNKFPQVGAKNHICGLPTLVLFYEGKELWRNEGLMKGEEIVRVLSGFQEGGWKKKKNGKEEENPLERKDEVGVVVGEGGDKKKKKRKGRRLGG